MYLSNTFAYKLAPNKGYDWYYFKNGTLLNQNRTQNKYFIFTFVHKKMTFTYLNYR